MLRALSSALTTLNLDLPLECSPKISTKPCMSVNIWTLEHALLIFTTKRMLPRLLAASRSRALEKTWAATPLMNTWKPRLSHLNTPCNYPLILTCFFTILMFLVCVHSTLLCMMAVQREFPLYFVVNYLNFIFSSVGNKPQYFYLK